jgi:hypothetical protein
MVKNMSKPFIKEEAKNILTIHDNCQSRIKPKLIRDVKTEAVLVFARTALERFFIKIEKENITFDDDIRVKRFYTTLQKMLSELQIYVVNVDYLMQLMQYAKTYPKHMELKQLAKYEEPLIVYYDAMAKKIEQEFNDQKTAIPEFIVLCVLSNWFLEDEKSTTLYNFIEKYDFLELIELFEEYIHTKTPHQKKLLLDMHRVSFSVTEILKKTKYKFNTQRVSKKRKR